MSDVTNKQAEQLLASNFNKTGTIVEKLSDPLVITPMLLINRTDKTLRP